MLAEAQVYILLELVDNVGHVHTDMQSTGNNAVLGRGGCRYCLATRKDLLVGQFLVSYLLWSLEVL